MSKLGNQYFQLFAEVYPPRHKTYIIPPDRFFKSELVTRACQYACINVVISPLIVPQ